MISEGIDELMEVLSQYGPPTKGVYAQMPTTKNIERQMFSVGDPISQKNSTSGFTWDRIPSKTK